MIASAMSTLNNLGLGLDTSNYLLATPVVASTAVTTLKGSGSSQSGSTAAPFVSAPTPLGMGPIGPGGFVFSYSNTGQDSSLSLPPMLGAGVGGDLFQGIAGDASGDFAVLGGGMTGTDVSGWNGELGNTSVAQALQNGNIMAAFSSLNSEAAWLNSLLPSYEPGASFVAGAAILIGAGMTCSPPVSAAATALGAMATTYSGGGSFGQAIKAGAASMFSAAMLGPAIACAGGIATAYESNSVNFVVNVLGRSAISGSAAFMRGYLNAGTQIQSGNLMPDFATNLNLAPPDVSSFAAAKATLADLGSASSIKLEALGLSAAISAAKAQGHHLNYLTNTFT